MGFASLKYWMNQHRSTAPKRCLAQACLTQYAASDAVLDKAAKGHQSLARSPFLTCPQQMQCHGDGHAQHANHSLLIISNPCLPRFLVRAEAFQETRNRCIYFLNAKNRTRLLWHTTGLSVADHTRVRFLSFSLESSVSISLAWCLLTSNGN